MKQLKIKAMKKCITYGKGISGETIAFDNDIQIGFYQVNPDGNISAKSISGQVIILSASENAEKLAKIFLCTYENHKTKTRKKHSQENLDGQTKMNLL